METVTALAIGCFILGWGLLSANAWPGQDRSREQATAIAGTIAGLALIVLAVLVLWTGPEISLPNR